MEGTNLRRDFESKCPASYLCAVAGPAEEGDLVLVKASPEKLQEVSRVSVLNGKTWNYPAIDGGRLLVRNTTEMAAFQIQ